jgi:hypothetical protein
MQKMAMTTLLYGYRIPSRDLQACLRESIRRFRRERWLFSLLYPKEKAAKSSEFPALTFEDGGFCAFCGFSVPNMTTKNASAVVHSPVDRRGSPASFANVWGVPGWL